MRCTVTVMVSAVIVDVLLSRSCSSLNHGLAVPTEGVAVTVPPPPPLVTVNATVVLRDVEPDVPVMVTLAVPSVAVPDAVKVAVTELPVVAPDGLKATVTPLGSPLAALKWLADYGPGLRAGQWVSTGSLTGLTALAGPCAVIGDFGPLGRVAAQLT